MKKVIVTGANGFVGRYLLRELTRHGYEIWSIVKDEKEEISPIKDLNTHIVYCDLKSILSLPTEIKEKGFDCFYHLAWAGSSGEGRKNYELQLENAKACADAARVAKELRCKRFIGAGSVTELMYREFMKNDGSEPEMVTCYAIGKIAAEYMTRCVCAENGVEFIWGYISNFYGAEDTTQNFINFLIKNYSKNVVPSLTSGEQKADFMYVSDVARALISMGEKGVPGKTYYVGYGKPRPLKEFIIKIKNIVNPEIDSGLGLKQFKGLDVDFDNIDIDKLSRDTDFSPEISFEQGVKYTLEWMFLDEKNSNTQIRN